MPWGKEVNGMIRILLVEDNPGDARLIREMLNEMNSATLAVRSMSLVEELIDEADRRMYEQKKGKKSAREGTRLILQ